MRTGIVMLNFGEPEHATLESVTPFLERIFNLNRDLEQHADSAAAAERARRLAAARAPALIAEYEAIGGSPLHRQARDQADALAAALDPERAFVTLGMQFTDPTIDEAVHDCIARGADRIVGLPVYPLCGPTTTVAALAALAESIQRQASHVQYYEISGWHRHPGYIRFRARMIARKAHADGLRFDDPRTQLVFSAHGTPIKYLQEGSRYEAYVQDCCAAVATEVGAHRFTIGYQNHSNRPLEWTQPAIESVIDGIDAQHVIVDAISFMHEQSETLAELDHELRERAEERGLSFHRVPIAHDDAEFIGVLADLVRPFLVDDVREDALVDAASPRYRRCVCRAAPYTFCLNAL